MTAAKSKPSLNLKKKPTKVRKTAKVGAPSSNLQKIIKNEKVLLSQLFESALEGIIVADLDHKVVMINTEFSRIFGYTAQEAIGRSPDDLIVPPDVHPEALHLTSSIEKGEKVQNEGQRLRKDGNLVWVAISLAPILLQGKKVGYFGTYRDIGERKKTEALFQKEKLLFEQLFESSSEAIIMADLHSKILAVNKEFTRFFGYDPEEALGRHIDDLITPPNLVNEVQTKCDPVVKGHTSEYITVRHRKDGSWVDVSVLVTPIMENGERIGAYACYRDISERKQAEQALQKEKAYLEQLFKTAQEAIVMGDSQGRVMHINPQFTRVFGYTAEEVRGRLIDELIIPPDHQDQAGRYSQTAAQGEKIAFEAVRRNKSGALLRVSCFVSPITIDHKQVGLYAVYRDITDQKQAEEALKTEKAYFQQLFEVAQEGVVMTDLSHKVIFINSAFTRIFDYSLPEAKGRSIDELVAPPDSLQKAAQISKQVTDGKKISFEARRRRKDHTLIDVACVATPIEIDGKQVGNYAVYRDISQHKKAEKDLEREKAYLEQLFVSAQEAIVITDKQGRVIRVNPEFTKIFGYTSEETQNQMIYDLISPPEDHDQAKNYAQKASQGEKLAFEAVRRHKDGRLLNVSCFISPLNIDGRHVANYAVYRDITDQKQAEEALKTEKAYFQQLIESAQDAIVMSDLEHKTTFSNQAFEHVFGYTSAETRDRSIDELIAPPQHWQEATSLSKRASNGDKIAFEGVRRRKDGTPVHVSCVVSPIKINDKLVGHYGVYHDISEQKKAEEALQREEAYLKQLFERSPVAIVMLDKEDRIYRLNEEFTRLFGYPESETLGRLVDDLILPEGETEAGLSFSRHAADIQDKKIFECRRRRKNGTLIDVAVLLSPVTIRNEHIGGYALYQDITERKKAEQALRRAHNELETRVQERTAQLAETNRELEEEMRERRRIDQALREG
ncbi:MAG: PAS domain S-box protein, partial [Desulfobacteraceae bacterium]